MNSELVRKSLKKLSETVNFIYPATGWYFSSDEIEDSFIYNKKKWVCMFMYWKVLMIKGRRIRFSRDFGEACSGPGEFFGFKKLVDDGGEFIAETERFKKNRDIAQKYYQESLQLIHPPKEKYLYFDKIENIDENREIDVVNIYPDTKGLTSLTVLSSYDRESNMDNVMIPFASGCQSVFAIPYNEKFQEKPKSVVGLMDTLVRNYIPDDMISFSMPSNRFIEMANNIEGSFLDKNFENPTGF